MNEKNTQNVIPNVNSKKKEERNVPDLGITYKLKDIAKIYDGTHQTPDYKSSGIPFVSVENIDNIFKFNKYISKEAYELEFNKNHPIKGDILMTRIGDIGTPALITKDIDIGYYVSLARISLFDKVLPEYMYFYIQTPYLLPTEPILMALKTAALAGVDVRIMIPARADTWITHLGSLSYLDDIMRAGVRIYLYQKGFLHSKLMVSDDTLSTVGSTNMDFRSFEHNFEVNAFMYDPSSALLLKGIFLQDQKDAILLQRKTWIKRPWYQKAQESIVRLLAPLL